MKSLTEMSENKEALVILVESVFAAVFGMVGTLPIPVEYKAPLMSMVGAIATAIFVYWKQSINVKKQ